MVVALALDSLSAQILVVVANNKKLNDSSLLFLSSKECNVQISMLKGHTGTNGM